MQITHLKNTCKNIRENILKLSFKAKTGHIASNLSVVEIVFTVLYQKYHEKDKIEFILSKGHASIAYFSCLLNFKKITNKQLGTIFQNNSKFGGHVTSNISEIIFSTGSLGHGLPYAAGLSYALNLKKSKSKVIVVISDGELNEGTTWETFLIASHHKLKNLCVIIDNNKFQALGRTKNILDMGNLKKKILSFGADVEETDGHDILKIKKFINKKTSSFKVLIAHTIKGAGIEFMEDKLLWHYKSMSQEDLDDATRDLRTL